MDVFLPLVVNFFISLASGLTDFLITKRLTGSKWIILGTAVLSFSGAMIITNLWIFPPRIVAVPDITGQYRAVAKRTLAEAGLDYHEKDSRYDNRFKDGQIISQNPAGGALETKGTKVSVVVSKGPRIVPDVIGMPETEAIRLLNAIGLRNIHSRNEYSNEPRGTVINQRPNADTIAESETRIYLEISNGPRSSPSPPPPPPPPLSVSISELQSGQDIQLNRSADGTYHFSVHGVSQGMTSNSRVKLLLWARPVDPPSETPGWYLQRPPQNGINTFQSDGSWAGVGQLGNPQWPPHEGNTFDVAVTAVDADMANDLLNESGVVTREDVASISQASAEVSQVKVKL